MYFHAWLSVSYDLWWPDRCVASLIHKKDNALLTKRGWILAIFFMDWDEVEDNNNAQKNEVNIQPYWPIKLDQ